MVAKNKKTDQPVLKMAKDANGMPIMVRKVVNGRTVTEPQTDADGNVTNVTVMAPKMIGATYKPKYITTKMRAALDSYIEKSKLLEPYLAKLNDPATYNLGEFEFMLTEFNVATIQRGEALPEPEQQVEQRVEQQVEKQTEKQQEHQVTTEIKTDETEITTTKKPAVKRVVKKTTKTTAPESVQVPTHEPVQVPTPAPEPTPPAPPPAPPVRAADLLRWPTRPPPASGRRKPNRYVR